MTSGQDQQSGGRPAHAGSPLDCHAHIYHGGMALAGDAWHRPDGDATIEALLAELDAAGVHRAVLAAASIYADTNGYMLEAIADRPRLRATAIVRPDTPRAALRALRDRGIVGVRFQWRYLAEQPDLTGADYRALLGHALDLGWHIQLHDNACRLAPAIAAIEAAGVPLVIDHFGRPDPTLGSLSPGFTDVLRAMARGGTWVKLSAPFRVGMIATARDLAGALLAEGGTERLLWGSDWPFAGFEQQLTYADALRTFETLIPAAHQRHDIHRTAARFYFAEE